MEEVYVNVPLLKQIEIENKTLLKTKFRWMEVSIALINIIVVINVVTMHALRHHSHHHHHPHLHHYYHHYCHPHDCLHYIVFITLSS